MFFYYYECAKFTPNSMVIDAYVMSVVYATETNTGGLKRPFTV